MRFYLQLEIDVDDRYKDKVFPLFAYTSHTYQFWHSLVPPHKVRILLGPLTETGVDNWLETMKNTGADFKHQVRPVEESEH